MFFHWSDKKDEEKRAEYKGIGFADVQTIFDARYYCESNDGYPGQYIVVGFVAKAATCSPSPARTG